MLTRTALALLLLLPAAAAAQERDTAKAALVRISGTKGGTTVRGSGFVVALGPDRDKATIVTASHVIAGVQDIKVTFAADADESYPASGMKMESDNARGLAMLQVRGKLPAEVTALSFEVEAQLKDGEEVYLLGFPEMADDPRTARRVLAGRAGTLLLIDSGVGEGFSGGPALRDLKSGKVVGVITDTDEQTTFAVEALVARAALNGWGVKLGVPGGTPASSAATPTKPAPPAVEKCVPGQEQTENGIVFVRICPGTFTMGSPESSKYADDLEKPSHQVTLSEFWLAKTETTNAQYRLIRPNHPGEDALPAAEVSWGDAKAACEILGGRLPTEAEWEYAARAGTQTTWWFGDESVLSEDEMTKLYKEYAWSGEGDEGKTHPVGTKKPNPWGLYDMFGNVWEWVNDWFGPYSAGAQTDPHGPTAAESSYGCPTARGGGFVYDVEASSATRTWFVPTVRLTKLGFRCALDPIRQP